MVLFQRDTRGALGRNWSEGFEPPASPNDTRLLFGRRERRAGSRDGSRAQPPPRDSRPRDFTPRDPPLDEFLRQREQVKREWQRTNGTLDSRVRKPQRLDGEKVRGHLDASCNAKFSQRMKQTPFSLLRSRHKIFPFSTFCCFKAKNSSTVGSTPGLCLCKGYQNPCSEDLKTCSTIQHKFSVLVVHQGVYLDDESLNDVENNRNWNNVSAERRRSSRPAPAPAPAPPPAPVAQPVTALPRYRGPPPRRARSDFTPGNRRSPDR